MCTSRTSEHTVLLWGQRWWLPGRPEPLVFDEFADAAHSLAMHFGTERGPVHLRLIYQPDTLVSVPVACPHGNRATLQKALAFDHPAIADPSHAWSYEPILNAEGGFCTYLHYEQEPGLFPLVAQLADHGIFVHTAWPLATFLHGLPAEWSQSGAVLVLAAAENGGVAYHHPAGGLRSLHQWRGAEAATEAVAWLRQAMEGQPDDPALLLITQPTEAVDGLRHLALTDALESVVVLSQTHPAQLLPAAPLLTPQRGAIAASILLLLAGGWSGATYARDYVAWKDGQAAAIREKSGLRAEIEHYRVNAREIVALRTKLAGPGQGPPIAELLDAVCAGMPATLALDRIRVEQGRFILSGHVAADAVAAWEQWRNRLGSKRWTLSPGSKPQASGAFTIDGVFTP